MRIQERDLSAKQYVYLWVDGIHVEARLEDEAQGILGSIGAGRTGANASGGRCPA